MAEKRTFELLTGAEEAPCNPLLPTSPTLCLPLAHLSFPHSCPTGLLSLSQTWQICSDLWVFAFAVLSTLNLLARISEWQAASFLSFNLGSKVTSLILGRKPSFPIPHDFTLNCCLHGLIVILYFPIYILFTWLLLFAPGSPLVCI